MKRESSHGLNLAVLTGIGIITNQLTTTVPCQMYRATPRPDRDKLRNQDEVICLSPALWAVRGKEKIKSFV